ncbi:MAG: IMP dehydrogenase [Bacteroidales bacterium]|nr:IMP dehydrogenase [Bacteroidales bacterium]
MPPFSERIVKEGVTFDDVLLVPAYSEVLPKDVSLRSRFTRNITLDLPFVSAAMDTVTESAMAIAMARAGGIGVIHKNMSAEAQAAQVRKVKAEGLPVAAGAGITSDILERVSMLVDAGADAIVLDSAHGHSKGVITALRKVKEAFPGVDVVVGNIATAEAAKALVDAGADALKVGIGPGSICTTRIVAGVGVPQITAIADVAAAAGGIPVIADGGLRYSGDVVKALAAGADCVMCGSMFAGTDEAPGDTVQIDGCPMKSYRGMGSIDAMQSGSADRYFQKGGGKLVPEGVAAAVPCKGPVADVLFQLAGGLRSGMGYVGAPTVEALHGASFIRISPASLRENHPHDVTITKKSPNYQ